MKKISVFLLIILTSVSFNSCELLEDLDQGLTTDQIVQGLKKALEIGTDSASNVLSLNNGYYGDALLRIPLPDEVEEIRNLVTKNELSTFFNLDEQFEKVIKSVNRAAESAAKDASPIFKSAIDSMSLADAVEILNGTNPAQGNLKSTSNFDSTAATGYFKVMTYSGLVSVYAPKINTALDNDLGLGFSANDAWDELTTLYNSGLNLINSNIFTSGLDEMYGLPPKMEASLAEFSTQKALDGLFIKVGDEEKKIRKDPFAWAVDIIQKVFGSVSG